ncbi:hypothetical protein F5B19DRAFT_474075, partial [Rostrohypoxylon terebratum]
MPKLPTPINESVDALPGSAEWLSTHLTGLGFGCKHLQKYSIRHEQSEPAFPSRLGFFYNAAENNARISFLDTRKLCKNCLVLVVPEGYNCWLPHTCLPTGPQSHNSPLLQFSASPSSGSFPLLFQAGTEGIFDIHGVPRIAVKLGFQDTTPVVVPMPQLPGFKEAWSWIQWERKPFYIDQLHLTKGWSSLARRAAERDRIIVQKHGIIYSPVFLATCTEPAPNAPHLEDEKVPRGDRLTEDSPANRLRMTTKILHQEEPTKSLGPKTNLPETSIEILTEEPPCLGRPLSSPQSKITSTPKASFSDIVTTLLANVTVKARPKETKCDTHGVSELSSKVVIDQGFPSREVPDRDAVHYTRKPAPTKNWCRHGPIPFDSPISTPKLSDFMRRAEVADEEATSVAHLPLRHRRGKGPKIEDSTPLVGPGSAAVTVSSERFLSLRGKKEDAIPLASSRFIESTFRILGTAIKDELKEVIEDCVKERPHNYGGQRKQNPSEDNSWNSIDEGSCDQDTTNQPRHMTASGLLYEAQSAEPDHVSSMTHGAVVSRTLNSDFINNMGDEASEPRQYYFQSGENPNYHPYRHPGSWNDHDGTAPTGVDAQAFEALVGLEESSDNDPEYEDEVPFHNETDADSYTSSIYSEEGKFFDHHGVSNGVDDGLGQYPEGAFADGSCDSDGDNDNENGLAGYYSGSEDGESEDSESEEECEEEECEEE